MLGMSPSGYYITHGASGRKADTPGRIATSRPRSGVFTLGRRCLWRPAFSCRLASFRIPDRTPPRCQTDAGRRSARLGRAAPQGANDRQPAWLPDRIEQARAELCRRGAEPDLAGGSDLRAHRRGLALSRGAHRHVYPPPATPHDGTCSVTSKASTIRAGCTPHSATDHRPTWVEWRPEPVHQTGGRSPQAYIPLSS